MLGVAALGDVALTVGVTASLVAIAGHSIGALVDRLELTTIVDPATGLGNRRMFEARLREEAARASRYATPLALLVIDVDHFKKINDTFGHLAGDRALCRVAQAVRATARGTDVLTRPGGDEFAILAPVTTSVEARQLAERIRTHLHASDPQITVSIGVADLKNTSQGLPRELFAAADQALFLAKRRGRDQVALAAPERLARGTRPDVELHRVIAAGHGLGGDHPSAGAA